MMIHDVIKIRYINDGYLPDYPYHMISDLEMILAFMDADGKGFFFDNYPQLDDGFMPAMRYRELALTIEYHLAMYLASKDTAYTIPDWVYSYMLGSAISVNSEYLNIHDLCTDLGIGDVVDEFSAFCSSKCYELSYNYLGPQSTLDRVSFPAKYRESAEQYMKLMGLFDWYEMYGSSVCARPPAMFGEPHVLKALRLGYKPVPIDTEGE